MRLLQFLDKNKVTNPHYTWQQKKTTTNNNLPIAIAFAAIVIAGAIFFNGNNSNS